MPSPPESERTVVKPTRDERQRQLARTPKTKLVRMIKRQGNIESAYPLRRWSRNELIFTVLNYEYPEHRA